MNIFVYKKKRVSSFKFHLKYCSRCYGRISRIYDFSSEYWNFVISLKLPNFAMKIECYISSKVSPKKDMHREKLIAELIMVTFIMSKSMFWWVSNIIESFTDLDYSKIICSLILRYKLFCFRLLLIEKN